jgi:hypothetical protein
MANPLNLIIAAAALLFALANAAFVTAAYFGWLCIKNGRIDPWATVRRRVRL